MQDTLSSHRLTQRVKLIQKIALIFDGKVLLLKRSSQEKSRPEKWDLPGGNSEWPVQPGFGQLRRDVVREVSEETNLSLAPTDLTNHDVVFLDTFFDAPNQVFSIIAGWKTELISPPAVSLSHEHTEFVWADLETLENYDFGTTGEFVKAIIKNALTSET